jgi:hypothetical protein
MTNLTIEGELFDCHDDPSIIPGAVLTEGMVATLQQTRRENLRNNFAKKVKEAKANGGVTPEVHQAFADYAAKYEFGVRQPGAPRVVRDPVEREAMKLIRSAITAAYRAKYSQTIAKEVLDEKAEELFGVRGEEYMKRAKKIVAEREAAAKSELGVAV